MLRPRLWEHILGHAMPELPLPPRWPSAPRAHPSRCCRPPEGSQTLAWNFRASLKERAQCYHPVPPHTGDKAVQKLGGAGLGSPPEVPRVSGLRSRENPGPAWSVCLSLPRPVSCVLLGRVPTFDCTKEVLQVLVQPVALCLKGKAASVTSSLCLRPYTGRPTQARPMAELTPGSLLVLSESGAALPLPTSCGMAL